MEVPLTFWLDVAKTFFGALLGAGLAFASNLYIQWRIRRDERIRTGNVALSIVVGQLNDFLAVRKALLVQRERALKQLPNCPFWLQFLPIRYVFDEYRLDVNSLAFLFDASGAAAMQKLLYVQSLHRLLRQLVADHSDVRKLIQERMAELGVKPFDTISVGDLEGKIGPHLIAQANSAGQTLLEMFDTDETEYEAAFDMMRAELIRRLGKRFVGMGTPRRPDGVIASTDGKSG